MMMKFCKSSVFLLVGIFLTISNVSVVRAVSNATTEQYFQTGRTSGVVLSSKDGVSVNGVIPSEYSFGLGNDFKSFTVTGGEKLTNSEINKWKAKPGESDDYIDIFMNKSDYVSKAVDSIKGNFSATYKSVGKFDGTDVDVKLTVTDFAVTSGDFYYKDYAPFVAFVGNPFNKIGVYVMNLDWVEVRYDFYASGTNNPIKVKGYTTYWDLDAWQGVHLFDNNKGIYVQKGVKLNFSDVNGVPFIYDMDNINYTGKYNTIDSFTELFEGASITRVYTPARPVEGTKRNKINRSRGMFVNSSVTAVPRKEYAIDTPSGNAHAAVKLGDTIKYEVFYTNVNQKNGADIVIMDTLSKGLEYVKGSSSLGDPTITKNSNGTTTLMWFTNLAKDSTDSMTYSALVNDDSDPLVNNKVVVDVGDNEYVLDPLYNPIPEKEYAKGTPSGKDGLPIKKGDNIRYNISYANPLKDKQNIIITDVISTGLKYIENSAKIGKDSLDPKVTENSDGTTTLVWTIELNGLKKDNLTYMVKVIGGVTKVKNKASIKYENKDSFDLDELINSLPTKEYASDTPKGKNGSTVKAGSRIKYSIKYANTYSDINTIKINDTLSKGLSYVSGSAKIGDSSIEPIITKNSDGTTTLVWIRNLEQGSEEELNYMVSVIGNTKTIKNKAIIQYGDKIITKLDELKNPVNIKIRIPDTASFITLSVLILGMVLTCSGVYIIYGRYKGQTKKGGKSNEK